LEQLFSFRHSGQVQAVRHARLLHKVTIQMSSQNGWSITKADPLRQGEGGISASQAAGLLPAGHLQQKRGWPQLSACPLPASVVLTGKPPSRRWRKPR
jgi:hypothetical protein